jgi:oxepin-CoA hydrolase/3-oxo-5,6-dehydrosuberyl-CoA semialdehyde dehydrogenase
MAFIELDITEMIQTLDKLEQETPAKWGTLSAQGMVEHLCDGLKMASGKLKFPLEIAPDKIEKMQAFLASDKPMAKNIEVSFAPKNTPLRHEEIELAIDEFLLEWIDFEEHFSNEHVTEQHPFYGDLTFDQWCQLHAKHFTHHFEQFGLI